VYSQRLIIKAFNFTEPEEDEYSPSSNSTVSSSGDVEGVYTLNDSQWEEESSTGDEDTGM